LSILHGREGDDGQWEQYGSNAKNEVDTATYTFSRDSPDWERCGEGLCSELYNEGVRRLSLFTTSLEEDESLLLEESFWNGLGVRQKMAFSFCLQEKKLLLFLLDNFSRQWWDLYNQRQQLPEVPAFTEVAA